MNPSLAPLSGAVVAAIAVFSGCPAATECQSLLDCPRGKVCNVEGTCVDEPDIGEGEGEPRDGGVGEGEGEPSDAGTPLPALTLQLLAPATMLLPDPLTPPGNALLAIGGPDLGTDAVSRFPINAETIDLGDLAVVRNFQNVSPAPGSCALDSLAVFSAAFLDLEAQEIWWSCKDPETVRIEYSSDPGAEQLFDTSGAGAIEVFTAYDSIDTPLVRGRVAFARRDGPLQIVQIRGDADGERQVRTFDDTASLNLNNVAAIYEVITNSEQLGDILLVYDRGPDGDEQRLVPIQRLVAAEAWSTTIEGVPLFPALPLPADTHFALFDTRVNIANPFSLETDDAQQDTPNVAIFRPVAGEVKFLRYENEVLQAGSSLFQPLQILGSLPATNPPPEDRVLLSPVLADGRTYLFYAMSHTALAWRLPVHENRTVNRTNEVIGATEDGNEAFTGILAIDGIDAWLAGSAAGNGFLWRRGFTAGGL